MIYFIGCAECPVVKFGVSQDPQNRLRVLRTTCPTHLELLAVDAKGDELTEAEMKWRCRDQRSHGEWYYRSPEVEAMVKETARTGALPGAWYIPNGYPIPESKNIQFAGPTFGDIEAVFGISPKQLTEALGNGAVQNYRRGSPISHTVRIVHYLQSAGFPMLTHTEFLSSCLAASQVHGRRAA